MTPERYRRVEEIFGLAIERDGEARARLLDEACGDSRTKTPRGLQVRGCNGVRLIMRPEVPRPAMRMVPAMPAAPAPPQPPEPRYFLPVAH